MRKNVMLLFYFQKSNTTFEMNVHAITINYATSCTNIIIPNINIFVHFSASQCG